MLKVIPGLKKRASGWQWQSCIYDRFGKMGLIEKEFGFLETFPIDSVRSQSSNTVNL